VQLTKELNYELVKEAIRESSQNSLIYLGCDSQNVKGKTIFGIAIIIHIDGHKGGRLFTEIYKTKRIDSIRQRLLKEVELSVSTAFKIIDDIGDRKFEIHLDVNGNAEHKSNEVCKEAIGYVIGQGFEYQIKPHAFAASSASDYCIKL
jgi:predicted RNase H-related nuclease YkuK (DUF458 family)